MDKDDIVQAYTAKLLVAEQLISQYTSDCDSLREELQKQESKFAMELENEVAKVTENWKEQLRESEESNYLCQF